MLVVHRLVVILFPFALYTFVWYKMKLNADRNEYHKFIYKTDIDIRIKTETPKAINEMKRNEMNAKE